MVAAGGGYPFLGGSNRVAEPAQAPDMLATLVGEGVIDQQSDDPAGQQAGEDQIGETSAQALGSPGGTLEEVVIGIQAVALGMIPERLRLDVVSDAAKAVLAQTQHPGEQELAVGPKGRRREGRCQGLDEGLQRSYHGPHRGSSRALHSLRIYAGAYEEPLSFSAAVGRRPTCSFVHETLRKSRYSS